MSIKTFIFIGIGIFCMGLQSFMPKSTGSHPSSTGAPGEATCAQANCHTDATINSDFGLNLHTFKDANGNEVTSYTAGEVYDITVQITQANITKFGFEIVSLNDDNVNSGYWIITDAARTWHQLSSDPASLGRRYVTHTSSGNQATSSGVALWEFSWEAPVDAGEGNINFYYTTSATNADGTKFGENLYLSNFTISENIGSGITPTNQTKTPKTSIFFNESSNSISLNFELLERKDVMYKITDLSGKMISSRSAIPTQAGYHEETLTLPGNMANGMYVVSLFRNNQVTTQKLIIYSI